ncbi:hypothetical protein FRC03_012228 [Tulasnella sp. 419]|nr:hypothetical protein FRC03_012228 [Tulasnella sp. 419]
MDIDDPHPSFASSSSSTLSDSGQTDARSVYSIGSSLDRQLIREISGRPFNALCDTYMLPAASIADFDEHNRLDLQHHILYISIDSLYAFPDRVRRALAPNDDIPPVIIDLGTGSGRWAVSMAEEFPYAEVVGLDLVPPVDITDMPLNCRFEIDDANLPMPHYTNCFNVVHCRSLEVGIKDFERLIYEIALMLRIGGIALISGGEMQLYGEDQKVLPTVPVGTPGFSWTNFYLQALLKAHEHRGSTSGEAKVSWNKWLANNPNFERTESFDILIPIGPWQKGLDLSI